MRKVLKKLQIFISFHFANYSKPFFIRIVSKWNDLPRDIVEAESAHHFKSKLCHYLFNKF